MKIADIIVKQIEVMGLTQAQAAAKVGVSRQNLWDKLNNRNPKWNTAVHILDAFDNTVDIRRMDGRELDFPIQDFMQAAREENLPFDALAHILLSMGYLVSIEKRLF